MTIMSDSEGELIAGRFVLRHRLGKGAQGIVFFAVDQSDNSSVAIKVQRADYPEYFLLDECNILKELAEGPGAVVGVPRVHFFGLDNGDEVMVLDCLGPSLECLLKKRESGFPVSDVLKIGLQAMDTLEAVHAKGFIHRNVSPANFVVGKEDPSKIFLIDFGSSRTYIRNGLHVSQGKERGLTGTPDFASVNAHLKMTQSRRDDLISLGYVLVYLFKRTLPWCEIPLTGVDMKKESEQIRECKNGTQLATLCDGLPTELEAYFRKVEAMLFEETPLYDSLRGLLKVVLDTTEKEESLPFCWEASHGVMRGDATV